MALSIDMSHRNGAGPGRRDDGAPIRGTITTGDVCRAIGQLRRFERGEEIYARGEKGDSVYHICKGAVRTVTMFADGRRQVGAFHVPREVFGYEVSARCRYSAEALLPSEILVVKRSHLLELAATSPSLGEELLSQVLETLRRSQEHILLLARQTAEERLRAFLADMAERFGNGTSVELPMDRRDIADYLGLALETVSRAFAELEQRGAIAVSSRRHILLIAPPQGH